MNTTSVMPDDISALLDQWDRDTGEYTAHLSSAERLRLLMSRESRRKRVEKMLDRVLSLEKEVRQLKYTEVGLRRQLKEAEAKVASSDPHAVREAVLNLMNNAGWVLKDGQS